MLTFSPKDDHSSPGLKALGYSGHWNKRNLGLLALAAISSTQACATVSPKNTIVTVKNSSSFAIPDLRIKAYFKDAAGKTTAASVHILDLKSGESQSIDLKGAIKKTTVKHPGKFVLAEHVDIDNLTDVQVKKVQPKGFFSRLKIKEGSPFRTYDYFEIINNPKEEYKENESGKHLRVLKVIPKKL